jgi:hypothetical protein
MEKLLNFLESNGAISYKIKDKSGKTLEHRIAEDNLELQTIFESDYELLENGVYKLVCGTIHNFREAVSPNISFKIGTQKESQTIKQSIGMFTKEDLERAKQEGKQEGIKEAHYLMIERRLNEVEKKIDKFNLDLSKLYDIIDELDGDKDGNFMSKAGELIGNVSELKETFGGLNFGN